MRKDSKSRIKILFPARGECRMVDLDDDRNMDDGLAIRNREGRLRVRRCIAEQFRRDQSTPVDIGPMLDNIRVLHE